PCGPEAAAGREAARERGRVSFGRRVAARRPREEVAQPREQVLGLVLGGPLLPGRASARLLERGAGLAGDGRLPAGGGQVLDRLRRVPEIEKGEPASVEALAVDLGHLVHQQELRESLDGLLQQRLLAGAVAA